MKRVKRAQRRRGKGASSKGDALGLALIAAVAAAIIGGLAAAAALRPPALDAETLCRKGVQPARHVIILVDATDVLAPRHKRALTAAVAAERAKLAPGDRFDVYALRPQDGREPARLFSKCDPGDASDVNPWFADAFGADRRHEEGFVEPLDQALRRAAAAASGPEESPLLDALTSVAGDPEFQAAPQRRLVLASDLLEHRRAFSLYDDSAAFSTWAASADAAGRSAALDGMAVRVLTFDRPDQAARQIQARDRFWIPYLEDAGAIAQFDP